jgi:predicted O-methyltransferase YrrM
MHRFNELVVVDKAHAALLKGLVASSKPTKVLELGLGGGESLDAILEALTFNAQPFELTLVDNWMDWGYQRPPGVEEKYAPRVKIIESSEFEFISKTKERYDFIMSDADHLNTHHWFEYVFQNILNDDGILVYHDVDPKNFPGLYGIFEKTARKRLSHHLFAKSSRADERCERGFLIIFKHKYEY